MVRSKVRWFPRSKLSRREGILSYAVPLCLTALPVDAIVVTGASFFNSRQPSESVPALA